MTVYPFVASFALSLSVALTAFWRLDQRPFACERIHNQEFAVD